jgi:hypothetical protein
MLALLVACSDPRKSHQAPDAAVSDASEVQAFQLYDESPVILMAIDEMERAVMVLGEKDSAGNPVSVTGAAFAQGDDYFSVRVDPLGRPVEIASPRGLVTFSDYTESSVLVESVDHSGELRSARIDFDPAELARLLVVPPSLSASRQKDMIDDALEAPFLALGKFLHSLSDLYGCSEAKHHLHNLAPKLWARVVQVAALLAECVGYGIAISPGDLGHIVNGIAALTASVGCASDIAAFTGATLTVPATLGASGGAAAFAATRAVVDCPIAAYKITKFLRDELLRQRLKLGFVGRCDGDLEQHKRSSVRVSLVPRPGDHLLSDVSADLSSLGGPFGAPLYYLNGVWSRSEEVIPANGGEQSVAIIVQGAASLVHATCAVRRSDELKVNIVVSERFIARDESVTVSAELTGGTGPYWMGWTVHRVFLINAPRPDSMTLKFTDAPRERTRYSLEVLDSSALQRRARAQPVWVEVCGDDYCGPGEKESGCDDDCADSGADAGADAQSGDAGLDASADASEANDADAADDGSLDAQTSEPDASADARVDAGADAAADASEADSGSEPPVAWSCAEACAYRANVQGCSGPASFCEAFCLAELSTAGQEGRCSQAALSRQSCRYSQAALLLGCSLNNVVIDANVCARQAALFDACEAARDAPNPPPIAGEPIPADSAFGGSAGCATSCDYRSRVLGCAGDASNCTAVCVAIYSAHAQQGRCSAQHIALEDCYYSRAALDRSCPVMDGKRDQDVCAAQSSALKACEAQ